MGIPTLLDNQINLGWFIRSHQMCIIQNHLSQHRSSRCDVQLTCVNLIPVCVIFLSVFLSLFSGSGSERWRLNSKTLLQSSDWFSNWRNVRQWAKHQAYFNSWKNCRRVTSGVWSQVTSYFSQSENVIFLKQYCARTHTHAGFHIRNQCLHNNPLLLKQMLCIYISTWTRSFTVFQIPHLLPE